MLEDKIYNFEDSESINDALSIFELKKENDDIRQSDSKLVLNFVGFVIKDDKILAVFPKHFFDDEINRKNDEINNIKLLFNTIRKYNNINNNAKKYIGHEEKLESDYPFEAFYKIYDYYIKYGIFKEEQEKISTGTDGKIFWKKTIQKSNPIISNGSIMFLPIFSKSKNHKYDFISECMIFVINHTIKTFPFFLDMKPIYSRNVKNDFLSNIDYTLRQLNQIKNGIFKDYQKKLINALIDFFEQYRKAIKKGGVIHFKINYFNNIWEKMVENYLNKCFIGSDITKRELLFDNYKNNKIIKFYKPEKIYIDRSLHKHWIQPDHFFVDDDIIYVCDSKYYSKYYEEEKGKDNLDYKQLAYTLLIGNSIVKEFINKKIFSTLILPGHKENQYHLNLEEEYRQMKDGCNYITEQYLDVRLLMEKYLM